MSTPPSNLPQLDTQTTVVNPGVPAVVPSGYLNCDFCKCKLTRTGEVINVSQEAREWRDAGEKHGKEKERLNEEISRLNRELAAKDAEITALRGTGNGGTTGKKFLR